MVRHAPPGNRQLAVVMGVTPDFAFAAAAVLQALRRFPPSSDFDVILFHSGIGEKDCRLLSAILPGRESAKEWLYEATARHAEQIIMSDQGILNLWLLEQGVEPDEIRPYFNWFRHVPGGERAKILHTVGHRKPWTDFRDRAWNGDYLRWIAEGGTPCHFRKTVLQLLSRSHATWANPFLLSVRLAEAGRFLVLNGAFVAAGKLAAISHAAKKKGPG